MSYLARIRVAWVALAVGTMMIGLGCAQQQGDRLSAGFANPPEAAKPHTWWHWMNGNVSKAGVTQDLEAMKRVGIGGAHLAQVGTGIPKGPVPYDSPEMVACVQFAFKEADRLGLDLCLFNCPGWSSSGGPWITPEHSMKVLVYTETPAVGGQRFTGVLAQPQATQNFYRDAMVIAYPTPAVDSRIPNFNNGAVPRGAKASASAAAPVTAIDPARVLDLSGKMNAQGQLDWDVPAGNWTILRIGFTTTGKTNHPGPDGGVGLEVDKFSREALDIHFNAFFGPFYDAMKPLAARGKVAALIDSYETGPQNWTDRFPQEFKKRRGYDLTAYMAAMAAGRVVGSVELSQRFLWDVRKTQAELMNENYYGRFTELCHQHGMLAYTEPYDTVNFDEMIAGSYADMPMGEFWQGQANQRSIKLVASVVHMNGQRVMGAESFTSRSRWTESPYSLKALGDFMWSQGLNKFVFHRYAMQPHPDPTVAPGMTMGPWGGHFDRTNTWFEPGRAWMRYIARSQFLLQQGLYVGDLVYFAGEDSPVRNPDQSRLEPMPPRGYGSDTIDTVTMSKRVRIVDGKITLPDGLAYRVFVLPPNLRTMSVQTLRNLHELVKEGMTLVVNGPRPEKTPSLTDYPKADAEVAQLGGELWGDLDGQAVTEHALGKGHVFWGVPLAAVLEQKLGAKPDFEFTSRSGTADINYIHRRCGSDEIYFVANRGPESQGLLCTFNVAGKRPEFWDAATGRKVPAAIYDVVDGRTRVPVQLAPSGSIFVVFREGEVGEHWTSISRDGQVLGGVAPLAENVPPAKPAGLFAMNGQLPLPLPKAEDPRPVEWADATVPLAWQDGTYTLRDALGQSRTVRISGIPQPMELAGPWQVTFPPKLEAPASATFEKLISWPESPDAGIKYFSGTATYRRTLGVPAGALGDSKRLFLDLGRVQVLAQVLINGKDLGIVWKLPFRLDITDAVHAGDNELEIRVTNLWPNRLIGDEQLPPENQYVPAKPSAGGPRGTPNSIVQMPDWYVRGLDKPSGPRITFTTWHHWSANEPLLESGLIGPVHLRTAVPLGAGQRR